MGWLPVCLISVPIVPSDGPERCTSDGPARGFEASFVAMPDGRRLHVFRCRRMKTKMPPGLSAGRDLPTGLRDMGNGGGGRDNGMGRGLRVARPKTSGGKSGLSAISANGRRTGFRASRRSRLGAPKGRVVRRAPGRWHGGGRVVESGTGVRRVADTGHGTNGLYE